MNRITHSLINIVLLVATLCLFTTQAAAPNGISYKGYLTDASNVAIASATKVIAVAVFNSESSGSPLYSETHNGIAITNGRFDLDLGSAATGWSSINFAQPLWLELTVDGETLAPRIPLSSVPYARTTLQIGDLIADKWCVTDGIQVQCTQDQPIGPEGPAGPQGDTGLIGIQGDIGPQGPTGGVGTTGLQGIQGNDGPAGPAWNGFPLTSSVERDAMTGMTEGLIIYNTTDSQIEYWDGTGWFVVASTPAI